MNIPTLSLDMGVRAYNILRREHIETLGQLAEISALTMLNEWRNCGIATIIEYQTALSYYGLELPDFAQAIEIAGHHHAHNTARAKLRETHEAEFDQILTRLGRSKVSPTRQPKYAAAMEDLRKRYTDEFAELFMREMQAIGLAPGTTKFELQQRIGELQAEIRNLKAQLAALR